MSGTVVPAVLPPMAAPSYPQKQVDAQASNSEASQVALDMADVSTAAASDTASPPLSPGGYASGLLSLPWHDGLSYFFTSGDLARMSNTCKTFRAEMTVDAPEVEGEPSRRLLVVPVLDLQVESAEAELKRVSLAHIHVLRVWRRLALVEAARAADRVGREAFQALDKFVLKGCPLCAMDVKELLCPMLASTRHLKLLNLEKNQILDPPIQQLCASGLLDRVETLNLRFNQIGDAGATAIARCSAFSTMKWVNLKLNRVTDKGALELAMALRHNRSMTLLNLRKQFPGLTDKSATGFAEMLATNSTLQQLRLRKNKITDEGASALATASTEHLARLCRDVPFCDEVYLELDLEENRIGDDGALELLRTATAAPARARVEILLNANPVTQESLATAVEAAGENIEAGGKLDATNPRVFFTSKCDSL